MKLQYSAQVEYARVFWIHYKIQIHNKITEIEYLRIEFKEDFIRSKLIHSSNIIII